MRSIPNWLFFPVSAKIPIFLKTLNIGPKKAFLTNITHLSAFYIIFFAFSQYLKTSQKNILRNPIFVRF